jgi:hypothetical protein
MCKWPFNYVYVAVYSRALGRLSASKKPSIHKQVAVYPHASGPGSTCIWPCIHVQVAVYPRACGCWLCFYLQVAKYLRSCGQISACTWPSTTYHCPYPKGPSLLACPMKKIDQPHSFPLSSTPEMTVKRLLARPLAKLAMELVATVSHSKPQDKITSE